MKDVLVEVILIAFILFSLSPIFGRVDALYVEDNIQLSSDSVTIKGEYNYAGRN